MSDYDDEDDNDLAREPSQNEVQHIMNDLTAACNSLGKLDLNDGVYMKDRDCKSCLKEIIRALNNDTKKHTARILIGQLDIVRNDLIPLMNQYCDYNEGDQDLFNLIIRLCTNITSSALLLFEHQEIPTEPERFKLYNQILQGLSRFKYAFADDSKIWLTLNTHLRHTEDEIPFERLLILIRNILHIPIDASAEQGVKSGFDAHEMCLYRMDKSGMFNTIIQIASETKRGMEFCFHVIEIVYLMLRDQNPVTVANAKSNNCKRKLDETDPDSQRLAELIAREKRERLVEQKKWKPNPRFKNSAFEITNFNSIGNRPVISSSIIKSREDITFDKSKTELRKSKNRKPMSSEANSAVISDRNTKTSRITYSLKIFSKLFVEKVYANYMQQIKHNLIQKKAAENDESYYLWSIQYFTSFSRHLYLNLDYISETMSTSSLHFIQILITSYQDKLKLEKKRSIIAKISKRLHLAIRSYREILYLIESIKEGSDFWNTIEKIKKNIFTEVEYNSLLLTLFQQHDPSKHCPEYLKDLIKANDVFLRLLEDYTKTHGPIEFASDEENSDEEEALLCAPIHETLPSPKSDPLAESVAGDELSGLDKPDGFDLFGPDDMNDQNQAEELGKVDQPSEFVETDKVDDPNEAEKLNEVDQPDKMIEPDHVEEPQKKKTKKKKKKKKRKKKNDYRTLHFMSRYCTPDVLKCYLEALRDFKTNDDSINRNILKFLERVAYDCKCEVMLMQASLLKCLLDVHQYDSGFEALVKHIMTIFGEMMHKKRWVIQELLFWKNHDDVVEIEMAIDPPPPQVADNPRSNQELSPLHEQEEEVQVSAMDQNKDQLQPLGDSLEDLMAELGSDSSFGSMPSVSNGKIANDAHAGENSVGGEDDEDDEEVITSLPQGSSHRRIRLSSESDESVAVKSPPALLDFPSDGDDLSSPPSPLPSPELDNDPLLSDLANVDDNSE